MSKDMDIFTKIKFIFRRPKVIVVTGQGRRCAKQAIFQVLSQYHQAGKNVLISESDLKNQQDIEEFKFLANNSSLFVLVVTHTGDILPERISFTGEREKTEEIRKVAKTIPAQNWLIFNFDDEMVREMADIPNLKIITFGLQQGADFQASDINLNPAREPEEVEHSKSNNLSNGVNDGTNFKINYKGSIVPVWLEGLCGKEQIYAVLAAACVGTILDLNLIEISQAMKNYRPADLQNLGT